MKNIQRFHGLNPAPALKILIVKVQDLLKLAYFFSKNV
jgi:hypothetical protein